MADQGFKRKLTGNLSVDAEGYSCHMDDDEEATVRKLILKVCCCTAILFVAYQFVVAGPKILLGDCIDEAINRTEIIKALPARTHLQTLDGQNVSLKDFFSTCRSKFPWCVVFEKFYYWENEIIEVISDTPRGKVEHKIRCYHNCLSTCCASMRNSLKSYGDVAEFYDSQGAFMGLAVYVGNGQYCSLPYFRYKR